MSVCVNVCVYVFLCVSAHLRVFVYVVCVRTHMCMFKSVVCMPVGARGQHLSGSFGCLPGESQVPVSSSPALGLQTYIPCLFVFF